jgi:nucleotide-binding universal stress UspA family protein
MNPTISRLVVGVDGSPSSIDAVRWAARYAELTGSDVEAVTTWSAPTGYGPAYGAGGFDAVVVDWADMARKTQETALEQALPGGSGTIRRTVVCDHPAAALVFAAQGAELLVVGSRGHDGFAGMLLGSVSAHVAAHAPCPVVVVRHLPEGADPQLEPRRESLAEDVSPPAVVPSAP